MPLRDERKVADMDEDFVKQLEQDIQEVQSALALSQQVAVKAQMIEEHSDLKVEMATLLNKASALTTQIHVKFLHALKHEEADK